MRVFSRSWHLFKQNKAGYFCFWVLAALLAVCLCAPLIANDVPLLVKYKGEFYFPLFKNYPDTAFGGNLPTKADYKDAFTIRQIKENGFMVMPPIAFGEKSIHASYEGAFPAPPSKEHWLGTDDQGRDVLARVLYGLRLCLLFGLALSVCSSALGIFVGAIQGYYGGRTDLWTQRFMEVWNSLPQLFILIIVFSLIAPSTVSMFCVLLLFSWPALVAVVRAEFLRVRNFDFVKAAKALGIPDRRIILFHVLPNALVAVLSYLPFIISGAIVSLTSLSFLGFGLSPETASLGDLIRQGKENIQAPWIGLTVIFVLSFVLSLLIFTGQAVRAAFDPKTQEKEEQKRTLSNEKGEVHRKGKGSSPLKEKGQKTFVSDLQKSAAASDVLLRVENLHISFGSFEAVKGISFDISRGQSVALLGQSGSGKTVTALSIPGLLQGAKVSGRLFFEGKDLLLLPQEERRRLRGRKIALIFQEPLTALNPLHRVEKQIMEVMKIHKLSPSRKKVEELLRQVGFDNPREKMRAYPHELSGGQRQRVMIAMALAGQPDFLIADEPTTALDVMTQEQILTLLRGLQKKLGLSLLFITHNLAVAAKMADKCYEMKDGKIISDRLPVPLSGTAEKKRQETEANTAVLSVRHLNVSYGDFHAVKDLSFTLKKGKTLGVVGESGCGKSSLALGLMRLIPASGEAVFEGKNLLTLTQKQMRPVRRKIQIVFQDPFSSLNPRFSLKELAEEGLLFHFPKLSAQEREQRIIQTFEQVGLDADKAYLNRYPHELSGGQRQRLALARALVLRPDILILDEPTSALDSALNAQILSLLKKIQEQTEVSYLFITHDMNVVREMADDVLVMKNGEAMEYGPAEKVLNTPEHPYTKMLLSASYLLLSP